MSSNLACVGWFVAHQAELGQLVDQALRLPSARQLGERDGVAVWRADDPSGARVVVGVRAGQIIDFLPTFAGQAGVLVRQLWLANPDVAQAAVVDSTGEQVSALAVELEERRLLGAPGETVHLADRAAPAVIVALGVGVGCFTDEAAYAASPASLLDPNADPGEPPAHYVENGWPWPARLGAQSFLSHGVWGEPAQSQAYARLAGIVSRVDTRANTLTGQRFHVARVRSFEMELDVCLAADEHPEPPVAGGVVAGTAFLTGTLLP